jgi:hypothetical protein
MSICNQINDAYGHEGIYCGIIKSDQIRLSELAERFSLNSNSEIYREIDQRQAEAVIKRILHRGLAYQVEIMPQSSAQSLAQRFLECFDAEKAQYYTNGDYYSDENSNGWNPATVSTFDTGILVIDRLRAGCLWVEDED